MAKKTETITLYVSEIVYEVKNNAYLTGKSRKNGENHEQVASIQASDDEEDKNQILRSIQVATAELRNVMSEYLTSTDTAGNNILLAEKTADDKSATIVFTLNMPSNFNAATVQTITQAAHDYAVNKATSNWLLITYKQDAADYLAKANANAATIREALSKRLSPSRTAPTTT
ncbi:MAG: hypothetical protein ACI4T5_03245 [Prevotella sp.]